MGLYVEPGYWRSGYVQEDADTVDACTFDGYSKTISVSELVGVLDIAKVYSEWKVWSSGGQEDDTNMKWPIAMRYSGKDPIPGGFTGTTFFMINGWKLVFNPNTTSVNGVLFSEDYGTAFWSFDNKPIYPITVSAVVNQVTSVQNVVTGDVGAVPAAVWNFLRTNATTPGSMGERLKNAATIEALLAQLEAAMAA